MKGGYNIKSNNIKEKTKEDSILRTYRKFKRIFKVLEKDRLEFADKLCRKAAFMDVMLEEMQETITTEGSIVEGINGNGFKVKMDNPAIKAYNVLFKNYSAVMKQLIELLPEEIEEADKLIMHIRGKTK